eukprot:SM000056S17966  [mRNA]  locus=s56:378698:379397:- [translate_table: standard]
MALAGLLLAVKVWHWFREYSAHATLDKQGMRFRCLSMASQILIWVIMLYFQVTFALLWAAVLSIVVIGVHGSCRLPPTGDKRTQQRKKAR